MCKIFEFHADLRDSWGFWGIPMDSKGFWGMPEDSKGIWAIPEDSAGFCEIPHRQTLKNMIQHQTHYILSKSIRKLLKTWLNLKSTTFYCKTLRAHALSLHLQNLWGFWGFWGFYRIPVDSKGSGFWEIPWESARFQGFWGIPWGLHEIPKDSEGSRRIPGGFPGKSRGVRETLLSLWNPPESSGILWDPPGSPGI